MIIYREEDTVEITVTKKVKAIVFKDLATWTYEERSVPEIKKRK